MSTKTGYKTDKQVNFNDAAVSFSSGLTSGLVCKCLTAPLSRLTILLQVEGAQQQPSNAAGTGSRASVPLSRPLSTTVAELMKKEGITSFWKGNWTSIIHKSGAQGVNYFVFEWSKNFLRPIWRVPDRDPGFLARALAGFMSGATALAVAYPLDLVRTRLACDPSSYHLDRVGRNNVIFGTLSKIWRQEGATAFLNGLPCTLLCQGLNVGLCFGIYETMNVSMLKTGQTRTGVLETMGCGAITGLIASSCVHPLDLIRRRQQLGGGSGMSRSILEIGSGIVKSQGIRGLYRGLMPELFKVMPSVGLNFYIYEFVRQEVFKMKVNPR